MICQIIRTIHVHVDLSFPPFRRGVILRNNSGDSPLEYRQSLFHGRVTRFRDIEKKRFPIDVRICVFACGIAQSRIGEHDSPASRTPRDNAYSDPCFPSRRDPIKRG